MPAALKARPLAMRSSLKTFGANTRSLQIGYSPESYVRTPGLTQRRRQHCVACKNNPLPCSELPRSQHFASLMHTRILGTTSSCWERPLPTVVSSASTEPPLAARALPPGARTCTGSRCTGPSGSGVAVGARACTDSRCTGPSGRPRSPLAYQTVQLQPKNFPEGPAVGRPQTDASNIFRRPRND